MAGMNPYELDLEELTKVQLFRDNLKDRGVLYRDFEDTGEFVDLVKEHLFGLIADEWRDNKWMAVVASAKSHPVRQELSMVVPPKRTGNAKLRGRGSESNENATPDEQDADESDEDEVGLLDHAENLHSVLDDLTTTLQSMSGHIAEIGTRISERTNQLNAVQHSEAKERAADGSAQQRNVRQFKQIIDGAADDLTQFVGELSPDVEAYRSGNRVMLSALRGMLVLRRELGSEADDKEELNSLLELIETMQTVKGQVGGFQRVMQQAPALTGRYKRAQRRGVSMLGELIAEMSFSVDEAEAIARNLRDPRDTDVPSGTADSGSVEGELTDGR